MPTPRKGYYLNGERLPSVTAITKMLEDQSGLMNVAVRIKGTGQCPFSLWGREAKVGTIVHSLAEMELNGELITQGTFRAQCDAVDLNLGEEHRKKAENAFRAFRRWSSYSGLKKPQQEISLICEEHGFGGTFDCLYELNGKYILCDWKTSKWTTAIHQEQLAAYGMIVEEHFGPVESYRLLRIDKETGDYHESCWSELEDGKANFLAALDVHKRRKRMDKRTK